MRWLDPTADIPPAAARDIPFERDWIAWVAEAAGQDPARLMVFAEQRAGQDPVRGAAGRDFGLEALEELADARNYLVWWAEQTLRSDPRGELGGEISAALGRAGSALVTAWAEVEQARALTAQLRRELEISNGSRRA
jgi:hypothetical protein